tara:strand:- start:44 stop:466 length:423 start_codon:yes stop_codon:yes gene_type:complete
MIKPGDSLITKKTIHELAKAFPDKTYRELEKYRDSDRVEESQSIPLTQAQKNLVDHLESAQQEGGACIIRETRRDREYKKEHKLRQEAEGELSIMKGLETNRVKEAQARANQLQDELDRVKKENNKLWNEICELKQNTES